MKKLFQTNALFQIAYAIGFSKHTVSWSFLLKLGNIFFSLDLYPAVYPKVRLVLFLIYFNDMSQAVKYNLFLYADDSCLVYQHKDINETEKQLNVDFSNICDWFVDNKLSIHFGED